jgi:hypothetical protein
MATQAQRDELAVLMDWLVAHREHVHYPPVIGGVIKRQESVADITSVRELQLRVLRTRGWTVDCSQSVIGLLLAVGCEVPQPDGYTGTLLDDLPGFTDARASRTGGLVVYGPGTGHHVTMTRHADPHYGNPAQWSQGSEPDPHVVSMLTEAAWQPHGIRLLSITGL